MTRIYVIAETSSLGESLHTLLVSDDWDARLVRDLEEAEALEEREPSDAPPLLVGACNRDHCRAFERWRSSRLASSELVVVGWRGAPPEGAHGPHVVPLPLRPAELLELVGRLLGPMAPEAGRAPEAA